MKKVRKIIIEITALLLCLILLIGLTYRMGFVLMPERYDYGGTWNMYLEEKENSIDIMVVGSSHAYCNIIPSQVYRDTGYSTYVLSAPCLTMPLAYYYLKEGLKTQSPKLIMLEVTGFYFNRYMGHAKAAIGYMPWSENRIGAIMSSAEPDERAGLLFPLYNYHDRWEDYELADYFKKRPDQMADINAGYTVLYESEVQTERSERVFEYTDDDIALQMEYLKKIKLLCDNEGIQLEMFIAPAASYVSEDDKQLIRDLPGEHTLTDFNDDFDKIGLDLERDFYDARHLNLYGATKFTSVFSEHILNNYSFDKTQDDTKLWQKRLQNLDGLLKMC